VTSVGFRGTPVFAGDGRRCLCRESEDGTDALACDIDAVNIVCVEGRSVGPSHKLF
jgi:hypothetical protein